MIFLSSSARDLEWFRSSFAWGSKLIFDSLILLSSSARGSKLILIYWYFYPPPLEVSKLIFNGDLFTLLDSHLKASETWFCFGLTLESQWNLILSRSYTWKPVKLVVQILPYVYLSGLTLHCQWLRFWLCHAYLLDWTYTFEANAKRFQIQLSWDLGFFENFDLFENCLLSFRRSFWSFYRVHDPFSLYIPVSDKKHISDANVLCNVWSWMTCLSI